MITTLMQTLVLSIGFAFVWVGVTGRANIESLLVGYVLSFLTLRLLYRYGVRFSIRLKLTQPLAFIQFGVIVIYNGLVSSIQLSRLLLNPKPIELRTAILKLETGDRTKSQLFAAFSAHAINLTPGELTVEFEDEGTLYIHCLDIETTRATLAREQARRMKLLQQMMGEAEHE